MWLRNESTCNYFSLVCKAKWKGKKTMQVLSVGTCWGWRALDSVSALWTDILPRSSLLLQSLADTLCPAQFVKEGMRKCKESELFMLHSKSSTGNEICPPFLLTGFSNSVWRTVTSWGQEDPSNAALCTIILSSLLSITANIWLAITPPEMCILTKRKHLYTRI